LLVGYNLILSVISYKEYLIKREVITMNKGIDNLIPFTERSEEEVKELNRKGGINSGIARRRKRTLREELLLLLEEADTQKNISVAMIQKAMNGDTKAFEIIRDTVGEKPTDKIDQEIKGKIEITEEDKKMLNSIQNRL